MSFGKFLFLAFIATIVVPIGIGGGSLPDVTINKLLGVIVTILTFLSIVSGNNTIRINKRYTFPVIVIIVSGIFGQIQYGNINYFYWQKMIMNLIMLILIFQFTKSTKDVFYILCAYYIGSTVAIMTGGLEFATSGGEEVRVGGILVNANGYGQICAHNLIISAGLVSIVKRKSIKSLIYGTMLTSFFGLLYSASRGAFITLICSILIVASMRKNRYKSIMVITIIFLLTLSFAPEQFMKRFSWAFKATGPYKVSGFEVRRNLAESGLKVFYNNPVFGVGIGNVKYETEKYMGRQIVTHNAYTQVLAETGVVGFIPFIIMLLSSFFYIRKLFNTALENNAHDDIIIFTILIGFTSAVAIGSLSSGNYIHPYWFLIFGIVGGLQISNKRKKVRNLRRMNNQIDERKIHEII